MTDEQNKPVRSREAQKWDGYPENPKMDGFHWLEHNGGEKLIPFEWDAHDELWMFDDDSICFPDTAGKRFRYHGPCLPPKARGAAEQRRKDAEGPVAYTSQIDLDRVRKGKSGDIYSTQKWEGSDDAVFTIPLYTHPANVAVLEGRIAELEKETQPLNLP